MLKKIPFYFMLLLLSIIYLICGYVVGYYHGYNEGFRQNIEINSK